MPFFIFPEAASIAEINLICMMASLGDSFMLVVMFWLIAAFLKSRQWIFCLNSYRIGSFLAIGILMTVVFEALAVGPLNRWSYSDLMPMLPIIGTGLAPILQWLTLPLLILWIVRRQLAGTKTVT